MVRYLRPLAIAVMVLQVCDVILVTPAGLLLLESQFQNFLHLYMSLVASAVSITATLLVIVLGTLAMIATFRRGQRAWSIVFLVLLLLSAYSPLLLNWIRLSRTPIYDPETFTINITALTLIAVVPQILSVILAVVVLVYSLRGGRTDTEARSAAA